MRTDEELNLLIRSKYPVIFFESVDESYSLEQLKEIASALGLDYFQWSLTEGLIRIPGAGAYYQTKEPPKMLGTVLELIKAQATGDIKPALLVLKDFHKYLDDALTLRLFKDTINTARNTRTTLIILSAECKIPKDIEQDCAHLLGGYPGDNEIEKLIRATIADSWQTRSEIAFNLDRDDMKKVVAALRGLTAQQIRNVINQCVINDNILSIQDLEIIEAFKKKVFDQDGLLEFYITEDKNNIAGFENLKLWLSERKTCFNRAATPSLPAPKGVLLMGIQGCGKSLAVKAIARELGLPLYRLDLSKLYSKYIGESEENLRKALLTVEKLSPACLWIDEIEKGFASSGGDIDGGVSQRILGTFLTWMQEHNTSSFLAATANNVYQLPPELLRKGRFDEVFFVDLPDNRSREQLFKIHLQKRNLDPAHFDINLLAGSTHDFSGAEIEQAVISALYRASSHNEPLNTDHILEQIRTTKPLAVLKSEEINGLRAWAKDRTRRA